MNKLLPAGKELMTVGGVKNLLQNSATTFSSWAPHQQLLAINLFTFAWWSIGSGINAQWMRSNLSMTPGAWHHTMLTTHFVHYDPVLLGINSYVLYKVGGALAHTRFGLAGYGALALGTGLCAAVSMYSDPSKKYTNGLGFSAGLCTFAGLAGRVPYAFGVIPAGLLFGLYCNDASVLGGIATGYALFMVGLF